MSIDPNQVPEQFKGIVTPFPIKGDQPDILFSDHPKILWSNKFFGKPWQPHGTFGQEWTLRPDVWFIPNNELFKISREREEKQFCFLSFRFA